jgi:hypothetical protein
MFERFAHKLAEKEICPNLVPQTGPTGGGDSKVDAVTYPVSEEIAALWYEGNSGQSAKEPWAFAFSTKKAWKAKVKADVAGIASTQRGYTRVYFITSRYVRDKERAEVQDELHTRHGFDVQILDRTWIVEKVFTNRRENLAIDTLGLERPLAPKVQKGPRDTRREAELDELERHISDPARYVGLEYQLVEDCLEASLLARGLERPRIEIDGRFDRAARIAERHGTSQQQLRVAYNRAWTVYWWYEDYATFVANYNDVEKLAKGSAQASDIELFKNLWQLLYVAVTREHLTADGAKLSERTATLRQELQRLRQDKTRPNTALQARVEEVFMDMVLAHGNKDQLNAVLAELKEIFEHSKGLVDFPARQLIDLLMELGEALPLDDAFDKLFEVVLPIAQERDSGATAGLMLLRRGAQKLECGQRYEAIRLLGRAQQRLALRECREELVAALALCARAYEAAGLFWAARASMLLAASQAIKEFYDEGTPTRQAYSCLFHLVWLELQLGRVPYVLALVNCLALFSHLINLDDAEREAVTDEWRHLDFVLGILLLKTDFFDLKYVARLPATLERFKLDFAWMALLYILGHEDRLRAQQVFPETDTPEDVHAAFAGALKKVDDVDLPQAAQFLNSRKIAMRSSVLGCAITAEVPNDNRPLFLVEAIFAALESFLSTSLDAQLLPYNPKLRLKVIASDFLAKPFEWVVFADQHVIELRYTTDETVDLHASQELIAEVVITITAQLAVPADRTYFEELFRDEKAMGRALMLTKIALTTGNVLGDRLKLRLIDWEAKNAEEFPLRRAEPWLPEPPSDSTQIPKKPLVMGSGEAPAELLDTERLKHSDRRVVSLINLPLWDKAGWKGAGFIVHPDPGVPPILALLFQDKDSGTGIFAEWRHDIGPRDEAGSLRITIITGIDRKNPAHYRMIVGSNDGWKTLTSGSHVVMISRVLTVTPTSTENLDRFLGRYKETGKYLLAPGHVQLGQTVPTVNYGLMILSSIQPRIATGTSDDAEQPANRAFGHRLMSLDLCAAV